MTQRENLNYHLLINTIPSIFLNGEWCRNAGHDGDYFVFRRSCGQSYYLNAVQLSNILNKLIFEF